ncbi:hypothetical protein SAMN05216214_105121 [Atopomonas hussainii]|uniref:Uncharacterized protein n=1 Tax=Atopomonas hussainii TaxID=1429083 RepID=A0A1H7K2I6_9GAMM|nr:hypothetical protein SAMN05216214_105121 [Atopomonas hussainii]
MSDEPAALARGAAGMPATLGEGCTRRFDPEALNENSGTDFAGAAALWHTLTATDRAESCPPPALPQTPPSER